MTPIHAKVSQAEVWLQYSAKPRGLIFYFFIFVYSLLACDLSDHGEVIYSPFPVRCPRSGGSLQAPLCPPPGSVPRRCEARQGNYKRKKSEGERQKERKESERRKERKASVPLRRSCRHHEVGRGEEQWSPPIARLLGPRALLLQPLPHLQLRHRAHSIVLSLSRHPPSHIRRG